MDTFRYRSHFPELEGFPPTVRDVRHSADLYVLAGRSEVTAMLASDEYDEIKVDYDEKSRTFFPRSYRPPPDLRFTNSDALFPPDDLRAAIEPSAPQQPWEPSFLFLIS